MVVYPNLKGIRILVTRPEGQARDICNTIEALGGFPIRFPTIEIRRSKAIATAVNLLEAKNSYNWLVFVSVNAVYFALQSCQHGVFNTPGLRIAAIGKATALALQDYNIKVDLVPKGRFNSEALLSLPQMHQVQGKRIVIVRGEGGRGLLAETLVKRGAIVTYAEVYKRIIPAIDLQQCLRQWREGVDVVLITSGESLTNLFTMIGDEGFEWLKNVPFVVVSPRIAEQASRVGLGKVVLAAGVSDSALLEAVVGLSR